MAAQGGFQVLGVDVQALGGDDYALLASLEIEVAVGVERAEVAGVEPFFPALHRLELATVPVTGGDVLAAHQDFATGVKLELASGQGFADGACGQLEGMVDADEGGGFGQAVALDDSEAQALPEDFGVGVEGGAAADEGPELPAQSAVEAAEAPPALVETLVPGGFDLLAEPVQAAGGFGVALDFMAQGFQQARHGDQGGNSFALEGAQDLGGVEALLEYHRAGQQRRDEQAQELAEDVAQRNQVQETDGMDEALVFQVGADFSFKRLEVGEEVAVGEDHALGVGGGAGGKNDLQHVLAAQLRRGVGGARVARQCLRQGFEQQDRQGGRQTGLRAGAEQEFGVHFARDPLDEIFCCDAIHRHHYRAAQHAAEKRRHPLGAVFAPEQDAVAGGDVAGFQLAGELAGGLGDLAVGPTQSAVAALVDVGGLRAVPVEKVEVFD